jgi:hypothetical protein
MDKPLFPFSDGGAPFHIEPVDVAAEIEFNALRHIRDGRAGLLERLVPALEREAIARLGRQGVVSAQPAHRPTWMPEIEWRQAWQALADGFQMNAEVDPESTAWAAAQVILRARDLREAIAHGEAEKAAALAMLLGAWVFTGGIGVKYAKAAPVAQRQIDAQRKRARKERFAVKTDDGPPMKKRDFVSQAVLASGTRDCTTPEAWPHLFGVLDAAGLCPCEGGAKDGRWIESKAGRFTFKGVQKMLKELRQAPAARGRPRKKPP